MPCAQKMGNKKPSTGVPSLPTKVAIDFAREGFSPVGEGGNYTTMAKKMSIAKYLGRYLHSIKTHHPFQQKTPFFLEKVKIFEVRGIALSG